MAALGRFISANSSHEGLLGFWKDLKPASSKNAAKWLKRGLYLDILPQVEASYIREIYDEYGDVVTKLLLDRPSAHRTLCEDDKLIQSTTHLILQGNIPYRDIYGISSDNPIAEIASSIIGPLTAFVMPAVDEHAEEASLFEMLEEGSESDVVPVPLNTSPYLDAWRTASKMKLSEWLNTLSPWDHLVEAGRREYGDCPAFYFLAISSARIRSRSERGLEGVGLLDSTISLCQRVRFARLKSGVPSWWRAQLAAWKGSDNYWFLLAVLFSHGTPATLLELRDTLWTQLDDLNAESWTLFEIAMYLRFRWPNERKGKFRIANAGDLRKWPLRFSWAFAQSLDEAGAHLVFNNRFQNYDGDNFTYLGFCIDMISKDLTSPRNWKRLIALIEKSYPTGVIIPVNRIQRRGVVMPANMAQYVCQHPQMFPCAFIRVADRALKAKLRFIPLAKVAEKERWFQEK